MALIPKLLNPRNMRQFVQIARMSSDLDKHMKKRCGYCDEFEMGFGDEVPITDFVQHLREKHPGKIKPELLDYFDKLMKKQK